ncbi:Ig-like domain-containing protein [Flammeovirga sp. SubArs3]|uniref:Ig-like domain-containing protein n=1 Tax=Flammeovirga sp. SubArs3 TaxID=2995316 RepID=UPI00248B67C3|nr:Ig-like domain-containing protein [Flammeovirga sp. SubArs3]
MKFKITSHSAIIIALLTLSLHITGYAQITNIGSGSYTTSYPGTDAAGRNSYPTGTPQLSGNAVDKPVPTNDWWSTLIQSDHASNLFNYPISMKTTNEGLVMSYISWGVFDDLLPIVVGVDGLSASQATVADHSDWTVTIDWNDGSHHLQATSGIGMPFVYFSKGDDDVATITINHGTVTVSDEMIMVQDAREGADFVIYAPTGSTWTQDGSTYSSSLNGQNYWSAVMLPQSTSDVATTAADFQKYAYVFPTNTTVAWDYDASASTLTTDFTVTTEVKEGDDTNMLLGLLPHQWANLSDASTTPGSIAYTTVRGELKMIEGNTFQVENTFRGILPTLPYVNNNSESFDVSALLSKVKSLENEGLSDWTDSYNEGQAMNRLIQNARIADLMGETEVRDNIITTIKTRLEDWLTAESGEVAFLFYYNTDWSAMLGYPAGHGQDSNLNDHHFHWGYFIHAAAFLEQYEPGWADQYGDMIDLLVRDASSPNRDDELFPFLRNFSPYAGHCWANGFASFPQGNDQESTSESMQFHSSLIHWGSVTGNDEIRDLGIYLYTTEQTAVEEYWFDMNERNFKDDQAYSLVSRVWSNSYDNGTFWTADIAASYNIELYPLHGGALYLGHNTAYVDKLWNEMTQNTDVLNNVENPNLWYDVMWGYLSFSDPSKALELYNDYPNRPLKFGVSDSHTYYWLHSMNALGQIDVSVTADHPMAVTFNNDGEKTYVAHNYGTSEITVTFSDGYELAVAAGQTVTNKDVEIESLLETSFEQAAVNGSIDLTLTVEEVTPTKVEFFDNGNLLGELTTAPFTFSATQLSAGEHRFYAKIHTDEAVDVSNIITVVAGLQVPFNNEINVIPGTIDAGNFDQFEGGLGQGITYFDVSAYNEGNYREDEYIDNVADEAEGATVGWTAGGEWMEYTVNVETAGVYDFTYRYASANGNGGGPFYLSIDDEKVSEDIEVATTGGWGTWASATVNNIELTQGQHILRVSFLGGEFNLGRMTFGRTGDLSYDVPVADAGEDQVVDISAGSFSLDGSNSSDPGNNSLTYVWTQVYGASVIEFEGETTSTPTLGNLVEGEYLVQLTVDNGEYSNSDVIKLIVTADGKIAPTVQLTAPKDGDIVFVNSSIMLAAEASDIDGDVSSVEFFVDNESVGSVTDPFELSWTPTEAKDYTIYAIATDNDAKTSTSKTFTITAQEAPSCSGTSDNGDYDFELSDASENPTLTFIPNQSGMGSPTCILFLSINGGGYGGYNATPNEPFQITAANGSEISFYYTYSHPEGGERNTSATPNTFVVGSCVSEPVDTTIPTIEIVTPNHGASYKEGTNISISVTAADTDGSVAQVEFFVGESSIGTDTEAPYSINWSVVKGKSVITAVVTDNDNKTATSKEIEVTGTSANSCYEAEMANGHFSYSFSGEAENPTLTFIPLIDGMGDNVLILFYKTGDGAYPGYNAKPNEPFQLNAPAGSEVSFYYTYSHPEGGERNTIEDIQTFTVGSCGDDDEGDEPTLKVAGVDKDKSYVIGQDITLTAEVLNGSTTVTSVEYFVNNNSVGSVSAAPYTLKWTSDVSGDVTFKATATFDDATTVTSEETTVSIGNITPFGDTAAQIPGTIESGHYDVFEFGNGQNITYFDLVAYNEGDYRKDEFVDVVYGEDEGPTIGWTGPGEWLRYTVEVTTSGIYSFSFRYASDNSESRGPFYIEVDGTNISGNISVDATGGWNTWQSKTVEGLSLTKGEHVMKVYFIDGGFNLGKMTFELTEEVSDNAPTVTLSTTDDQSSFEINSEVAFTATAEDEDGTVSKVDFYVNDELLATVTEAPYTFNWTGDAVGEYTVKAIATDNDELTGTTQAVINIVDSSIGEEENVAPTISVATSDEATTYTLGATVSYTMDVADTDGSIEKVEVFVNDELVETITAAPFELDWTPDASGTYEVEVVVTDDQGATTSASISIVIEEAEVTSLEDELVKVSYYPNPVSDILVLDLPEQDQNINIINIEGKLIRQLLHQGNHVEVDFQSLKSGIYFIQIQGEQQFSQIKVIKQ